MSEDIAALLEAAAAEVLEAMFFVALDGGGATSPAGAAWVGATVAFSGTARGALGIAMPAAAARIMAADFLGVEEEAGPNAAQVDAVVRELANMICGAAASRLNPAGEIRLSAPASVAPECAMPPGGVVATLFPDPGPLCVGLAIQS